MFINRSLFKLTTRPVKLAPRVGEAHSGPDLAWDVLCLERGWVMGTVDLLGGLVLSKSWERLGIDETRDLLDFLEPHSITDYPKSGHGTAKCIHTDAAFPLRARGNNLWPMCACLTKTNSVH